MLCVAEEPRRDQRRARLPDLMVPVRMEFASEFGSFTAELAELRDRGADLRLSE